MSPWEWVQGRKSSSPTVLIPINERLAREIVGSSGFEHQVGFNRDTVEWARTSLKFDTIDVSFRFAQYTDLYVEVMSRIDNDRSSEFANGNADFP